jgi:hypothetical protein
MWFDEEERGRGEVGEDGEVNEPACKVHFSWAALGTLSDVRI